MRESFTVDLVQQSIMIGTLQSRIVVDGTVLSTKSATIVGDELEESPSDVLSLVVAELELAFGVGGGGMNTKREGEGFALMLKVGFFGVAAKVREVVPLGVVFPA